MDMQTEISSFPQMLRFWRRQRGYSQLDLALAADVSQRHVSFLESARAKPSREMVLQLASELAVPLRHHNRLLMAAGYAPTVTEHKLADPPVKAMRQAIDLILAKQEPYPAVVLDRLWNILDSNRAHRQLLAFLLGKSVYQRLCESGRPLNMMKLVFDPQGLRPHIANWEEVARYLARRLHQEVALRVVDAEATGLLAEVMALQQSPLAVPDDPIDHMPMPVLPVQLQKGDFRAAMFSTITMLGTARDITLQELRIESFFPIDASSEQALRGLSEERVVE